MAMMPNLPPEDRNDLGEPESDLDVYTHLEHLVGEEARLREEQLEHLKEERHERLRVIEAELDRVWEMLRERAEHHGKTGSPGTPAGRD